MVMVAARHEEGGDLIKVGHPTEYIFAKRGDEHSRQRHADPDAEFHSTYNNVNQDDRSTA